MPDDGPEPRLALYRDVWCAYWREAGKPRRISLGTADREEARRALADLKLRKRQRAAASAETVAAIVDRYIDDRKARKGDDKSLRWAWNRAAARFGALRPEHVTPELCRAWSAEQAASGKASGTSRKTLAIMAAALTWADRRSPARIELPAAGAPRSRHLTRPEASLLIQSADVAHVRLYVILALATAARPAAILDMTWDRVDLDAGRIDLGPGSGNKRRAIVPINEMARTALTAAKRAALSDYVVEWAAKPVASVKRGFASAATAAGLEDVTPYTLRHTAAVWMAEAGVPMSEISQFMGHTSSAVTERVYARYSPDYLRRAAAALEVPGAAPRVRLVKR